MSTGTLESAGWWDRILQSGLQQGPSFVVLVLILAGLARFVQYVVTDGVPKHLELIREGYREIQEAQTRDIERLVTAFENDQNRDKYVVTLVERLVDERTLIHENRDRLNEILSLLRERNGVALPIGPARQLERRDAEPPGSNFPGASKASRQP